jgi:hypothetical protein
VTLGELASGLIAASLALWLFGGFFARLGGLLLVLIGAAALALGAAGAPLTIAAGALLWLLGHLHYAVRHHSYKSPLARRVLGSRLPPRFDSTREREE